MYISISSKAINQGVSKFIKVVFAINIVIFIFTFYTVSEKLFIIIASMIIYQSLLAFIFTSNASSSSYNKGICLRSNH